MSKTDDWKTIWLEAPFFWNVFLGEKRVINSLKRLAPSLWVKTNRRRTTNDQLADSKMVSPGFYPFFVYFVPGSSSIARTMFFQLSHHKYSYSSLRDLIKDTTLKLMTVGKEGGRNKVQSTERFEPTTTRIVGWRSYRCATTLPYTTILLRWSRRMKFVVDFQLNGGWVNNLVQSIFSFLPFWVHILASTKLMLPHLKKFTMGCTTWRFKDSRCLW